MGIRPKLLIIIVVLGFAPMLLMGVLMYSENVAAVEEDLRAGVVRDADRIALKIDSMLREAETTLASLACSTALRSYVSGSEGLQDGTDIRRNKVGVAQLREDATERVIPEAARETVRAFVISNPNRYASITCLSSSGKPLFRAEPVFRNDAVNKDAASTDVEFKTGDYLGSTVNVDARVWSTTEQTPLRSRLTRESTGATLRYSVPVFKAEAGTATPRGALIAELAGNVLFADTAIGETSQGLDGTVTNRPNPPKRFVILLDHDKGILYHTNEALRHQRVDAVLNTFGDISSSMIAGEIGSRFYDKDGVKWLVAYRPVPGLAAYVGVAGDYTGATRNVRRIGWIGLTLFSVFGLVTIVVLSQILQTTARGIERVTEGAVAIAGGRLEQRIEVRSNDETRLLAESFNAMTDRLREQIVRETESRQFESFMRLSAMLTHDLKNAIAGLSLLVGNMEKQFHREEFRADAMEALTGATDKLRKLVSKLSEPVLSLSNEHQLACQTDLVPIIRNALATTFEPTVEEHEIVVQLPKTLVATVEADRIERVFENLIINALEAMGAKTGKLTVEAGQTNQGEVFFSVSDTGPGISEEFQRVKLFRPFATTKKNGIGLGLYTCREILEAHGGRIEVISKRGSGATFRAVLPSQSKATEGT